MSAIKPGTLCLIKRGRKTPEVAGMFCTFIRYEQCESAPLYDCIIDIPNAPAHPFFGREYYAPSIDLLPIQGDPDQILAFECEREHTTT